MRASADRQWRRLYLVVIFAAFPVALLLNIAKLFALWAERRPAEWSEIGVSMASSFAWVAVAPLIVAAAQRFPLATPRWKRNTVILAVFCGVLSVVAEAFYLTTGAVLGGLFRSEPIDLGAAWRATLTSAGLSVNVMLFGGTVAATYALDTFRRNRERERRKISLEAKLAETRLQLLRMQLHPHFLFNALNAVSALIEEDVDAADRMLSRLISFFEFSLDSVGKQEVTLEHELAFLRSYVEIEQTRFGDRLAVAFDIDRETLSCFVPGLILQPIVENSIRHGIAPRAQQGRVLVRTRKEKGRLRIEIEDDGVGITARQSDRLGIGLGNTRARLEYLYGREQSLEIAPREHGGTRVCITLPARIAPALEQMTRTA